MGDLLRSQGIQVIVAEQCGVFSRILTDFGPSHKVIDKNGEELLPVMMDKMSAFTEPYRTRIDLLTGARHGFEEGDTVTLSEVIGMTSIADELTSVNGMNFIIKKIIDSNSFVIDCDSSLFTAYERNGVAKHVKMH